LSGLVVVRLGGVFFIMITLALGQMGWAYFLRARSFGGFGGLSGIPQLDLGAVGLMLANPADFALFAIVVAAIVYVLLAGAVAGFAGTLVTQRTSFVSPDLLVWTTSGEVLVMVIVGGLGTLTGPII